MRRASGAKGMLVHVKSSSLTQVQEAMRKVVPVLSFVKRSGTKECLMRYGIDLKEGHYRCVICGRAITTYEDVGMLISNGKKHVLVCSKQSCMTKADLVTIYDRYLKRAMETFR